MSKKIYTPHEIAGLKSDLEAKQSAFKELKFESLESPEAIEASKIVDNAQELYSVAVSSLVTDDSKSDTAAKSKAETKLKNKKIKFLLSPTGKYNLGYNAGEVAEINENQAQELVDAKYAEFVK